MSITNNEKKLLFVSVVFFFFLKLLLSVWPWFDSSISGTDLSTYRQWSIQLIQEGIGNFYRNAQFFPYPPVANYFFLLLGAIAKFTRQPINGIFMTILFKLPNILGEIAVSLMIYSLVKNNNSFKLSYSLLLFYLIQPAVIFITSVWGQWDGVMIFFLFAAFYLLNRKQITAGFVLLILSLLTKPQIFPFLPPLVIFGLKKCGVYKFLLACAISVVIFFALFFPFFPQNPIWAPYSYFKSNLISFSPRFTSSGFNLWYLLYGGWQDVFPVMLGISTRIWTRILTVGFILACTFFTYYKNTLKQQAIAIGLSGYTFFLFFTQIKERYFYGVLPFILLGLILLKNKYSTVIAITVSLLFALNTIGFYIGWIGFGLWNSTFLAYLYLDKLICALYIYIYFYLFYVMIKPTNIKTRNSKS